MSRIQYPNVMVVYRKKMLNTQGTVPGVGSVPYTLYIYITLGSDRFTVHLVRALVRHLSYDSIRCCYITIVCSQIRNPLLVSQRSHSLLLLLPMQSLSSYTKNIYLIDFFLMFGISDQNLDLSF